MAIASEGLSERDWESLLRIVRKEQKFFRTGHLKPFVRSNLEPEAVLVPFKQY